MPKLRHSQNKAKRGLSEAACRERLHGFPPDMQLPVGVRVEPKPKGGSRADKDDGKVELIGFASNARTSRRVYSDDAAEAWLALPWAGLRGSLGMRIVNVNAMRIEVASLCRPDRISQGSPGIAPDDCINYFRCFNFRCFKNEALGFGVLKS